MSSGKLFYREIKQSQQLKRVQSVSTEEREQRDHSQPHIGKMHDIAGLLGFFFCCLFVCLFVSVLCMWAFEFVLQHSHMENMQAEDKLKTMSVNLREDKLTRKK